MPAAPIRGSASPPPVSGEPVLEASGVKRWFGANRALDGVDLTVGAGEIRGVIGPNGSGKTTLLNCVSGFLSLNAGAISYRGRQLAGRSADSIARAGLVRTFQEPEVFASFTVGETCELVVDAARRRSGLNDRIPSTSGAMLSSCGLEAMAELPVAALPHGQLRLLGVVTAIACRPHLLLLDEPAAGLATRDASVLRDVLRRVRELGTTVVVVDHDMSFLLEICDRVTVLDGGRKLAEGDPDQITSDPAVIAAYLGESFVNPRAEAPVEGAKVGV
jgi:branched-chain amino acid transport system permease protein